MIRETVQTARALRAFVNHPLTNLVKGLVLLAIGISDAWGMVRQDVGRLHLRVGHGLIVLGLFSVIEALPHFLDGLSAGERFLEARIEEETIDAERPAL